MERCKQLLRENNEISSFAEGNCKKFTKLFFRFLLDINDGDMRPFTIQQGPPSRKSSRLRTQTSIRNAKLPVRAMLLKEFLMG